MPNEENKDLARRYFSADASQVMHDAESGKDEFHSADLMAHFTTGEMNYDAYMGMMKTIVSAFPDLQYHPEDIIAEGDKVVTRYTFTGTHQGDFQGIPATGKKIKVEGIGILRIRAGRILEFWAVSDSMGMMQQLGVVPS